MPKFGPIKRKDLIRFLLELGFIGPYSGGKHQFMVKNNLKVRIPNYHKDLELKVPCGILFFPRGTITTRFFPPYSPANTSSLLRLLRVMPIWFKIHAISLL